jgi:hypothetical protein
MKPLLDLVEKGGPAIVAIMALSVVLYARCFRLLFSLRQSRRALADATVAAIPPADVPRFQREVRDGFREQRVTIAAMIAAAPLLGLFGTVSGMVKTFEQLAAKSTDRSMEGLARGISEVLVATESGLLVALPAMALVWLAHREMQRHVRALNEAVIRA